MATTFAPAPVEAPPVRAPRSRPWVGLFAVLTADLLNLLDGTVGSVASPSIRADLGGSTAILQWIAAGYTLAMAVGLLTGGRLGDMFGRKRMMMIGIAGFIVSSLLCAVAVSPEMLIAARVLQGVSGAVLIPQSFGLLRDLFGRDVGKAFAVLGPVFGLATIIGPVVAGLLIEADWFGAGWRMIFLINLPLGLFALVVGQKTLPAVAPAAYGQRLDVRGALLAAAGLSMLIFPLVHGHELGWPAWSLGLLAASLPVLGLFFLQQRRRARTGRSPLVELSVFAKRSYTSGVAFVIAFFGAIAGFSLAVGLFLQLGLGFSPLAASLAMAPWAVGAFGGSIFGGTLMNKLGRHIVHIGLALMAVGLTGLYLVLDGVETAPGPWDLTAPLAGFGLGMGMIFVPLFDIIVGGLDDHEVGSGSGMLESFQQAGASLGVAVLGTVFFTVAGPRPDVAAFVDGAGMITVITIGLTVIAFVLAFLLPKSARAH